MDKIYLDILLFFSSNCGILSYAHKPPIARTGVGPENDMY